MPRRNIFALMLMRRKYQIGANIDRFISREWRQNIQGAHKGSL